MTRLKLPSPIAGRRMNLLFDAKRSEGLGPVERDKVVLILAQILTQAAGLNVEELEDDKTLPCRAWRHAAVPPGRPRISGLTTLSRAL